MEAIKNSNALDFVLNSAKLFFSKTYPEVCNNTSVVQYYIREDSVDKIVIEMRNKNSTINCVYNEYMCCEYICIFPDENSEIESLWMQIKQKISGQNTLFHISLIVLNDIVFFKIIRKIT